jgi:hypothetical protein
MSSDRKPTPVGRGEAAPGANRIGKPMTKGPDGIIRGESSPQPRT